MERFRTAQDAWSERLITQERFCDAVAVLGPDGSTRVPFIRALLANLSEPLNAALYGSFQESKAREIRFKDISPEAFDVMLRSSCHLDPKLTPERALASLTAASLYLIEDLEALCREYLEQIQEIPLILKTLTAATKLGHVLPRELQRKFWIAILLNSEETVKSLASVEAHGSIVDQLIKLDELEIDEELLWGSLVDWVAAGVRKPEILGPFADTTLVIPKRSKTDASGTCDGPGANELAQKKQFCSSCRSTFVWVRWVKSSSLLL